MLLVFLYVKEKILMIMNALHFVISYIHVLYHLLLFNHLALSCFWVAFPLSGTFIGVVGGISLIALWKDWDRFDRTVQAA